MDFSKFTEEQLTNDIYENELAIAKIFSNMLMINSEELEDRNAFIAAANEELKKRRQKQGK